MARSKNKQRGKAAHKRSPNRPANSNTTAVNTSAEATDALAENPTASAEPRRRVERVQPGRGRPAGGQPSLAAAAFAQLDSDDAAIPFDRVPYVPGDLRRVALMALLMVVLIVLADWVVSH